MLVALFLLCVLLLLLRQSLQQSIRFRLQQKPSLLFAVALALSILFCLTASAHRCLSPPLALLIFIYTLAPCALIYAQRDRPAKATVIDFVVILMLWLPVEFSVGATLISRPAQGALHAAAYAIGITLGAVFFVLFREWAQAKYRPPWSVLDWRNAVLGVLASIALLIPLGLRIGFLGQPHWPRLTFPAIAIRTLLILFGTAFPEEILFRGFIQSWFTERIPQRWMAVIVSALIFGAAHLDNGPGPLPNWRYMIVATVAGLIFGIVFLKSESIFASAMVHAAVDTTKHLFF